MVRFRWTQIWRSLGLEFWLLLPLLGLGLWVSSGILTDRMLIQFTKSDIFLEGDRQPKQPAKIVNAIIVTINQQHGSSTAIIQTANSTLKRLTFEFPTTVPEEVEAAISRELGLPRDRVRALVRYQSQ